MKKIFTILCLMASAFAGYAQIPDIFNVTTNPASPASLATNREVTVDFDYTKPNGDIRIFLIPMFGGVPAQNYRVPGSLVYSSNSGHVTYTFTLTEPGSVDQICLLFGDPITNLPYMQWFTNVNFSFVNYELTMIDFNPPSPYTLASDQRVNATFSYTKPDGDILIYVRGFYQGHEVENSFNDGSQVFSANAGSGTGFVGIHRPGAFDMIEVHFIDATTEALLQGFQFAVNYTWVNYEFTNVVFNPVSPATLAVNQQVQVTFNYSKPNGDVVIFAQPMYLGVLNENYLYSPSGVHSVNNGSAERFISLSSNGYVDQIRLLMADFTPELTLLHEQLINVNYTFTASTGITDIPLEGCFNVYPVPCLDELTLSLAQNGEYEYRIYSMQGSLLVTGISTTQTIRVPTSRLVPGTYFVKVLSGNQVHSRLFTKE